MECPICFEYIKSSCFGSCHHHFCFDCLSKSCLTSVKCPICKVPINQIVKDKEFDLLLSEIMALKKLTYSETNDLDIYNFDIRNKYNNIIPFTIFFNDDIDKNISLTLKNNNSGPGVIIHKISYNCRAYYYGLRKNDIIIFINNITCYNHKQAIDIIDNCQLTSSTIKCEILRK